MLGKQCDASMLATLAIEVSHQVLAGARKQREHKENTEGLQLEYVRSSTITFTEHARSTGKQCKPVLPQYFQTKLK